MKLLILRLMILGLLGTLFGETAFGHTQNNTLPKEQKDPTKVKKVLKDVQNQIKKLEKSVYSTQYQEKQIIKQLSSLEKEIGECSEHLRVLQDKKLQHSHALMNLQNEANNLKSVNQAQQQALAQLIQITFRNYREEKLRFLLEQKELANIAKLNQFYQYFYEARVNQIYVLQQQLKQIQVVQTKIQQEQNALQNLAKKHHLEQTILQEKKDKRTVLLSSLTKQLSSAQAELSELQQQEEHLSQIFKTLQKNLVTIPINTGSGKEFSAMKKKLVLPIQEGDAKLGVLPSAKSANLKKSYISAKTGTPVTAIFSGKVVFAEWLRGIGLLMIIDHGNGYMSLYGNNQKLYKELGDWVNQGEMIARVGQSGGHAEPGLYFEIRKDGEALDPSPWFMQG